MKRILTLFTALILFASITSAQNYLEVPALHPDESIYMTTYMEQNDDMVRSFTYRYDPSLRIALWVAYPLNAGLIGNGSRGEGWLPDPNIPEKTQAVLYKGFKYGSGYDRGHQIPSADRLDPDANAQTFRFTNATPQLHDFNGGVWAELEKLVRTWAKRSDTLYVVTGCRPGNGHISDNAGNPVNIPSAYYKVLLRRNKTRSGRIEWSACAIVLPHKVFPVGTWKENVALFKSYSLPVSDVEKLTDENFFPLLSKYLSPSEIASLKDSPADPWWWK